MLSVTILGELRRRIAWVTFGILAASNQLFAQETMTTSLIRQEVVRCGGEWEGNLNIKLLGFIGKKFTNEHFEMLSHLRGIEWFYCDAIEGDSTQLRWLYDQEHLKRMDLLASGNLVNGLGLMGTRVLGRIEKLRIEKCTLSTESLTNIAKMGVLETAEFLDVTIDDVSSLTLLTKCENLKSLEIAATHPVDAEIVRRLRQTLKKCAIQVLQVQKRSH